MKKKIMTFGIGIVMGAIVLAGCGGAGASSTSTEATTSASGSAVAEDTVLIKINTYGLGEIAYAEEGTELKFDSEAPTQSAFANVAKGTKMTIAARVTEEGMKFKKWTKNGEKYSTDEQITITADEDAEYIAEFGPKGSDETHVDLEKVKTVGEVMGLPSETSSCTEEKFVYVFEQDDNYYRAIANCTPEVFAAVSELSFDDADYDSKLREIVKDLEVISLENLTEAIPKQEELDKLVGKTGEDLIKDGWTEGGGWNYEDMIVYMNHGVFSYEVEFEGKLDNPETAEFESIKPLVVKSVKYTGIGDAANPDAKV